MPDLGVLLGLLIPVAALLFLNLRRHRRLSYPHYLLKAEDRRGRTAFLLGAFRTHGDLILDALAALWISLAVSTNYVQIFPPPRAVVVEVSASMLRGQEGHRPLDKALERLAALGSTGRQRSFVLASDPEGGGSRLWPLKAYLADGEVPRGRPVLGNDYKALASLGWSGYGPLTLLTDRAAFRASGFSLVEVAPKEEGLGVYFTKIEWDEALGSYRVILAVAREPEGLGLYRYEAKAGAFLRPAPGEVGLELRKDSWAFTLAKPGLYRLSLRRHEGEAEEGLAFRLLEPKRAAAAQGDFSRLVLQAFPLLVEAPQPRILLRGGNPGGQDWGAQVGLVVESRIAPESGSLYLDPAVTGGRPILGADLGPKGPRDRRAAAAQLRVLALGPEARASEDLPLAYRGILREAEPRPYLTAIPPGAKLLYLQDQAVIQDAWGYLPLNPPPEEFFLPQATGSLDLAGPSPPRWPWALLLCLTAAAKLLRKRHYASRA